MSFQTNPLSDCNSFSDNCTNLDSPKNDFAAQKEIAQKLHDLPVIKARPGFDQRMAAAFAMELQKETVQRNKSWLKKHPHIKLPEITTGMK